MLLAPTKTLVRAYIISAYDLASRDNGGFSDPYLLISLGKKKFDDRENYLSDEPNPNFYKMIEFEAEFPGCPMLDITVMDYDLIFGDEAIGTTKVDLEDRFFSTEWQSLKHKPVEYRTL